LDSTQISGFLWFELLITASYLGIASALVERVIKNARGSYIDRAVLGSELEGAMLALEGMARSMMVKLRDSDELARMLFVRYAVQQAIARASLRAVEILGGMAFISSSESSYLLAATRALAFHPPSQLSMAESLSEYLNGQLIKIQ
jgi:alkylation response protein AidB-like acyl-CoA dehydrogenase